MAKQYSKEKILSMVSDFLDERVENDTGGWTAVSDDDMKNVVKIFSAIIDAKFERDCDGDATIQYSVINRQKHYNTHPTFNIPYATSEMSLDELLHGLELAESNVSSANNYREIYMTQIQNWRRRMKEQEAFNAKVKKSGIFKGQRVMRISDNRPCYVLGIKERKDELVFDLALKYPYDYKSIRSDNNVTIQMKRDTFEPFEGSDEQWQLLCKEKNCDVLPQEFRELLGLPDYEHILELVDFMQRARLSRTAEMASLVLEMFPDVHVFKEKDKADLDALAISIKERQREIAIEKRKAKQSKKN